MVLMIHAKLSGLRFTLVLPREVSTWAITSPRKLPFDNWVPADICCYPGMHAAQTDFFISYLLLPYVCPPSFPFDWLIDLHILLGEMS